MIAPLYAAILTLFAFPASSSAAGSASHYVTSCLILNAEGKPLRRFPGKICLFHPDGRLFSADDDGLTAYDKHQNVLWKRDYFLHHQMNWSVDGKSIVTLGSKVATVNGKAARTDVLYVIGLDGSLEKSFSFVDNWELVKRKVPGARYELVPNLWPWSTKESADWELMHANSFYEIPPNSSAARLPAFAAGNYIVNDPWLARILIFDRKLKRILFVLDHRRWNPMHDVQVRENGNILVYANTQRHDGKPGSSLHEYDPRTKKIVWFFEPENPEKFNSSHSGGLQVLPNGNILYSDITGGIADAVEISRAGKEIRRFPASKRDADTGKFVPVQQVKAVDLRSFLKNNAGL